MQKDIKIVLIETSHPGNIGAAARAMKTMGLTKLVLVSPKIFPSADATAMASGAEDILDQAQVVETLDEALQDCQLILGTSARNRYLDWPMLTPKQAAVTVAEQSNIPIAILFGRERTGLTNAELQRCHYHITIPSDPNFSSLNIASAVQVIAYELYSAEPVVSKTEQYEFASEQEVERFYQHLEQTLIKIGFLNPAQPKFLMLRLRRLFQRAQLQQQEVNILRGICRAAQEGKDHGN